MVVHLILLCPQVANIVGRAELLSAVLFLLSLLSYHRCLNQTQQVSNSNLSKFRGGPLSSDVGAPDNNNYSLLWLLCTVFLGVVSMLCKEQGVTVLGVCIAYDLFVVSGKDMWEFFAILKQAVTLLMNRKDAPKKRSVHVTCFQTLSTAPLF